MKTEDAASHLAAIREMVERSRHDRIRTGDIYVVWAVVVIAALLGQVMLDRWGFSQPWMAWFMTTPAAVAYSIFRGRQQANRVFTYANRVEARTWLFTGLAMGALAFGGPASGMLPPAAIVPILCSILAVALATAGALYRYRPVTGSAVLFLIAGIMSWFLTWQLQFALFAVVLLLGYVVPGIWMMRAARG
ncbi:MAG: hypothetical protein AAGA48_01370 [Myxococcota bacterium]